MKEHPLEKIGTKMIEITITILKQIGIAMGYYSFIFCIAITVVLLTHINPKADLSNYLLISKGTLFYFKTTFSFILCGLILLIIGHILKMKCPYCRSDAKKGKSYRANGKKHQSFFCPKCGITIHEKQKI